MIKVSVIMATYNHEKYIAKAIESAISQKCDFEYEILVGDDASADGTGNIVAEYGRNYPDLVKAIVRKKNLGATKNLMNLFSEACGEYVAFLEGDDCWIDEMKLQKQVDFLDAHPEFAASFGRSVVNDGDGNRNESVEQYMPWIREGVFGLKDFENFLIPGQTATAMYRIKALKDLSEDVKRDFRLMPKTLLIDRFLVLGILSKGKIDTMPDELAAYRYVTDKGSGSWSSKNDHYSFRNVVLFLYGLKEMERVAARMGMDLSFDELRNREFSKIAEYKGKMPGLAINTVRFFIWLWYKDKKKFGAFLRERHSK